MHGSNLFLFSTRLCCPWMSPVLCSRGCETPTRRFAARPPFRRDSFRGRPHGERKGHYDPPRFHHSEEGMPKVTKKVDVTPSFSRIFPNNVSY